jgi:hypothetical protein
MVKGSRKTSEVPGDMSIQEASDFWDKHSFLDYDDFKEVDFEVDIKSEKNYFAIEKSLARKIYEIARSKGISSETLINLWVKEKLAEILL